MSNLRFLAQEIKLAEQYTEGSKLESTDDFHYYQGYIDGIVQALESLGLASEINELLEKEDKEKGN
jgi:hypothetical protein